MKKKMIVFKVRFFNFRLDKKEIIKKAKVKSKIFFDKKKINLINIGRFTDQKDQLTLLKALEIIKHKVKFNLLIIGYGEEKNNLINYINPVSNTHLRAHETR